MNCVPLLYIFIDVSVCSILEIEEFKNILGIYNK